MTETERIVRRVEAYAPMPDEEIYADFIWGFLRGKKRAQMLTGQRYYENRGDILRREKVTPFGRMRLIRSSTARVTTWTLKNLAR